LFLFWWKETCSDTTASSSEIKLKSIFRNKKNSKNKVWIFSETWGGGKNESFHGLMRLQDLCWFRKNVPKNIGMHLELEQTRKFSQHQFQIGDMN